MNAYDFSLHQYYNNSLYSIIAHFGNSYFDIRTFYNTTLKAPASESEKKSFFLYIPLCILIYCINTYSKYILFCVYTEFDRISFIFVVDSSILDAMRKVSNYFRKVF